MNATNEISRKKTHKILKLNRFFLLIHFNMEAFCFIFLICFFFFYRSEKLDAVPHCIVVVDLICGVISLEQWFITSSVSHAGHVTPPHEPPGFFRNKYYICLSLDGVNRWMIFRQRHLESVCLQFVYEYAYANLLKRSKVLL